MAQDRDKVNTMFLICVRLTESPPYGVDTVGVRHHAVDSPPTLRSGSERQPGLRHPDSLHGAACDVGPPGMADLPFHLNPGIDTLWSQPQHPEPVEGCILSLPQDWGWLHRVSIPGLR